LRCASWARASTAHVGWCRDCFSAPEPFAQLLRPATERGVRRLLQRHSQVPAAPSPRQAGPPTMRPEGHAPSRRPRKRLEWWEQLLSGDFQCASAASRRSRKVTADRASDCHGHPAALVTASTRRAVVATATTDEQRALILRTGSRESTLKPENGPTETATALWDSNASAE
jgi:hypothetical protein